MRWGIAVPFGAFGRHIATFYGVEVFLSNYWCRPGIYWMCDGFKRSHCQWLLPLSKQCCRWSKSLQCSATALPSLFWLSKMRGNMSYLTGPLPAIHTKGLRKMSVSLCQSAKAYDQKFISCCYASRHHTKEEKATKLCKSTKRPRCKQKVPRTLVLSS